MGLKAQKFTVKNAAGVDQRINPADIGAQDISAFRWHPEVGGWKCDRGIEPWWDHGGSNAQFATDGGLATYFEHEITSIFSWKHYLLIESNGSLYYFRGNKNNGDFEDDLVVLATGRRIPSADEVGTQYIPFKNGLIIFNGHDKPLWFTRDAKIRTFGFTLPTPAPEVLPLTPDYLENSSEILNNATGAPTFDDGYLGLGQGVALTRDDFAYAMTFVTDNGSESPMSAQVNVGWTSRVQAEGEPDTKNKWGVSIANLPVGGPGVVARRIYRSKNQLVDSTGTNNRELYLLKTIKDNSSVSLIDVLPDQMLVNKASAYSTAIVNYSQTTGCAWDNRVWLAGGTVNPGRMIYSEKGYPEQITELNYIDVEGEITGVKPYFNNLIVFKKDGIDVVRDNGGIYTVSALHPSLGTTAINTVQLVPTVGLVFLTYDGFYALTGGLDGGNRIEVKKISKGISEEVKRIGNLPRACSVYSKKEKEYWCHYAQKGQSVHSRGAVLHTEVGEWSLRHPRLKEDAHLWAFTAMTVERDGTIVMGTKPTWETNKVASDSETTGASGHLVGPQVWSAAPYWGKRLLNLSIGQGQSYSSIATDRPESTWESSWIDFGNNSLQYKVHSVEVELVSEGDVPLYLDWAYDGDSTWNEAGAQRQVKPERAGTSKSNPVLGPTGGNSKSYFNLETDKLKNDKLVRLRWDVATATVDDFKFRLRGSGFHLVGFTLHFDSVDRKPLNQAASRRKSQPW